MQLKHIINRIFLFLFLSLFLVTACTEMDTHSTISRFQSAEKLYSASLRWGEWSNLFHLQRNKPDSTARKIEPPADEYVEHLETIRVAHIEVLNSIMDEQKESGSSTFLIEFQFENSAKINKIRHKVDWWYDSDTNHWFTETPLPQEFALTKSRTIKLSPSNF